MKGALIQILIKRFGPSALRAGLLAVGGLIVAHSDVLTPLGISYDEVNRVITISLDAMTVGATVLLVAFSGGAIKVGQKQAEAIIPKKEEPKV